jgi:hypothetical protein
MNTGHRIIRIAVALIAMHTAGALAQHVPETLPRAGEARFNAYKYKASHNSYRRSEDLDVQIDDYNVWCVELDLKYDKDESVPANKIKVEHLCVDSGVGQKFEDALTELNRSSTARYKATVLWLQLADDRSGNACGYDDWKQSEKGTWLHLIKNSLTNKLGASTIYPSTEFVDQDNQRWPSQQELVRRGYKWIVVIDRGGLSVDLWNDDLLFSEITDPLLDGNGATDAFRNKDGGTDANTHQYTFAANGARWMRRAYPNALECVSSDGAYWENAIAEGFNLIATDCVDDHGMVTDPRVHSPVPLYVDNWDDNDKLWGTKAFPARYLGLAYARVSTGGLILIKAAAGETSYSNYPTATTLSKSCVIRATGGGDAVLRVNP